MVFKQKIGHSALDLIPEQCLTSNLRAPVDPAETGPSYSAVQVVEGEKKSRRLNEVEKRSIAPELWKEVLEGMVACRHKQFLDRCEVLKYLRDVWTEGKDVYSAQVCQEGVSAFDRYYGSEMVADEDGGMSSESESGCVTISQDVVSVNGSNNVIADVNGSQFVAGDGVTDVVDVGGSDVVAGEDVADVDESR